MQLPNGDFAEVPLRKITEYLLSAAHPEGAGKAAFFIAHGFAPARPQELIDALLIHARTWAVGATSKSDHGIKYVLDGEMHMPDGRSPIVRSIWIVEPGRLYPRFVTAFPGPRKREP